MLEIKNVVVVVSFIFLGSWEFQIIFTQRNHTVLEFLCSRNAVCVYFQFMEACERKFTSVMSLKFQPGLKTFKIK